MAGITTMRRFMRPVLLSLFSRVSDILTTS
jgi:hypothetical protein